jgi:hypothetical protein
VPTRRVIYASFPGPVDDFDQLGERPALLAWGSSETGEGVGVHWRSGGIHLCGALIPVFEVGEDRFGYLRPFLGVRLEWVVHRPPR